MKNNITKNIAIILVLFACIGTILSIAGCKKDWLNKVPTSGIFVPSTLTDYENLLFQNAASCKLLQAGGNDTYVPQSRQASLGATGEAYYRWDGSSLDAALNTFWTPDYQIIYTCNVVIDGLTHIERTPSNSEQWDQVYGSALLIRANSYFYLSQLWMKTYDASTANKDLGVPLRLKPDITEIKGRGSVQAVYEQMITDLTSATPLLFNGPQPYTQFYKPTKAAAWALLARIYLIMENYAKAKDAAEKALSFQSTLLDYNTITPAGTNGVKFMRWWLNPEVFYFLGTNGGPINNTDPWVDPALYNSFVDNDLRKTFFFELNRSKPDIVFSGSYVGISRSTLFFYVAVDELYLIRAECGARLSDIASKFGLDDLNKLLKTRFKTGTYTDYTAATADQALSIILSERKKELIYRGVSWSDLRRLNKDSRFQTTVTRTLSGQTYTLLPNSNKYLWPIPSSEIKISGIPQNPQ